MLDSGLYAGITIRRTFALRPPAIAPYSHAPLLVTMNSAALIEDKDDASEVDEPVWLSRGLLTVCWHLLRQY
jgi:hypothetical protein